MRVHHYMAPAAFWLALLLNTGCGSGATTTATPPPPPPPPPTPGAPATITVQAGDGQSAAINAAVPIRPVVIIKDAAGTPVPGVLVTFSVDSGGGALTGGSVTTGTDGIATIGGWILGPTPGANVLRVTVAGLAPKLIVATAVAAPVQLATNYPIGSAGGTFTYAKPGDPLNGLALTVPAAAFGHATQWSLVTVPGGPPSLPVDAFTVAPMLSVTNNEGVGDSLVRLRIPVRAGADTAVAAFFYDPATGTLEMAPIIGREAGAVTIASRHFSADQLLARATTFPAQLLAGGPGGVARSSRATSLFATVLATMHAPPAKGSVYITIVGIKRSAILLKQINTTFDPAIDTWEFPNRPTWAAPAGISAGMAISEVDYHVRYKPLLGALPDKFYKGPGGLPFWGDDPAGLRMSSVTDAAIDKFVSRVYVPASGSFPATLLIGRDQQVFDALCVAMYLSQSPQVLIAQGDNFTHGLVVYGARPGQLLFSDPNIDRSAYSLPFDGTNLTLFLMNDYAGSPDESVSGYTVLPISSVVSSAKLSADWARTKAGTIGNTEFPSLPLEYYNYTTQTWDPIPAGDTLRIESDTFLVRNNCGNCPRLRSGSPLATRQYLEIFEQGGVSVANDRPDFVRGALVRMTPAVRTLGLMSSAYAPEPGGPFNYSDLRWLTVVSTAAKIGPRNATFPVDSSFTMYVNKPINLPAGITYHWSFTRTDGVLTTTISSDTTALITALDIGTYQAKVELRGANNALVAADSTTLTISPLQLSLQPTPLLRANPGDVKTLTTAFGGFRPAGIRYDWIFGDQGLTRVSTTTPTTTHSWATVGTYTASVQPFDNFFGTALGGAFTTVVIKNWPGAWQVTSFQRTGETLTDQFTIPRDAAAWKIMRDSLDLVEQNMSTAVIFLDDPQLWPESAVYFEIFPPLTLFFDLIYWQPGGMVTQLARTNAIQFSHYTQAGNTRSGFLDGVGYVTSLNGSFLNSINATKTQTQLIGTMTVGLYAINGSHGTRTYQFTATRISP